MFRPAFLQSAMSPFLALAVSVLLTGVLSWVANRLANPIRNGLSKAITRLTGIMMVAMFCSIERIGVRGLQESLTRLMAVAIP